MARTRYYCAASLDGFIADTDDDLDWLTGYQGSFQGEDAQPMKGSYDRFYEGIGALVMGSVTFSWIRDHLTGWPYSGKSTWVLSSRDLPAPEGEDVRIVSAPVSELHAELLAAAGERDVWVVGGGHVASQFADAGLLDELWVQFAPVALGAGSPLLPRHVELRLEEVVRNRDFACARYAVLPAPGAAAQPR